MTTYWLSVVRFVPDPAKGEFVNVGAIAGSDETEEWEARSVAKWTRAKSLNQDVPIGALADFISKLQMQIELAQEGDIPANERFTLERLRLLSAGMNNIVQISAPVPVALPSLSKVIDFAFQELIVDPQSVGLGYLMKPPAVSAVKAAYKASGVNPHRDARVTSGQYDTSFDFAVANGEALQLVKCWSFQLLDQDKLATEIRAWAWGVGALRSSVTASALVAGLPNALLVNGGEVDVEVVFVPPAEKQENTKAYKVAMEAFRDTRVNPHPMTEAPIVAQRAKDLLSAHASMIQSG